MTNLTNELTTLLNKYSLDAKLNTPDFLLAEYLVVHLDSLATTLKHRDQWHLPKVAELVENAVTRSDAANAN